MQDIHKLFEEVLPIITQAGEKILSYYGQVEDMKTKGEDSPVTRADLESNKILIKGLQKFGYPILSEESSDDKSRLVTERVWIIDPLDGTKDFLQETGEFTVMVGLVDKNEKGKHRPVLGVVYQPVSKIFYCAIKGGGAWARHEEIKPRRLRVSTEDNWSNVTLLTSRHHSTDLEKEIANKLNIPNIATYGSSLKACLIAEQKGHINLNPAPFTWEWDVCASDIIIHEAGGRFTDSQGEKIMYNKDNPKNEKGYLASSGTLHDAILEQIKLLSS